MRSGLVCSWVLALGIPLAHAQREGQQQWRFSVGGYVTLSSPALSPDGLTLYIGVQTMSGAGRVVAISTRDGGRKEGWPSLGRQLAKFVESSPALSSDGSTIYVGSADGKLYSLRSSDGGINWDRSLGGVGISSSPAIAANGTIYVGTGDGDLCAVSPGGTLLWRYPTRDFIFSSPAIGHDGTIYIGSFNKRLYAITPAGDLKWDFETAGEIFSSPAIGADGTIYVGSRDQRMYAIAPDGTKIWDFLANGPIDASPTVGQDGTIYFAADRRFYALRPEPVVADRQKWIRDIADTTLSTAALRGDGVLVFGTDSGLVRALKAEDGSDAWPAPFDTQTRELIESSPAVGPDGSIYVGSSDGAVYKITGNGSPLSSFSSWPSFHRDPRRTAQATANTGAQLVNLSTRAQAGGGRNLIAGFIVHAPQGRAYLVRAVGPGLAPQGVGAFLPDPALNLFSGQNLYRSNDNWLTNDEVSGLSIPETSAAVQAFSLESSSRDSVILDGLPSGAYTAQVVSADARSGVGLVEVYDVRDTGDPSAKLVNLSTRGFVGTGETTLIAGFVVGGSGSMRLLLRGIGPGLSQFGVPGVLAQPRLTLFSGGTPIATNANWVADGFKVDIATAAAVVSAFPLVEGRADSALLFEAKPGPYTLQITGVGETTGETMVEIYALPY